MFVDTPITVRYADTDMMGVVYHANYLLYFEDARADFLAAGGFSYMDVEEAGYQGPVYHVDIQYGVPLRFGEPAFVRTEVDKSLPSRTVFRQRVFRASDDPATAKPLVDAHITLCLIDKRTFKPVSIKRVFPEIYEFYNASIEAE